MALVVLALCFALSVLGRGLAESFTVFLKPISESMGWDRAEVVSIYSLAALAGGLAAPLIGRLFDHSGPRAVYALGLLLLGSAFLIAASASQLWQFRLSLGLCVGIGVALIGLVPNSILLGRWFGPRLPTAMSVIYSATGAGVLILLPASQLLIDSIGWRSAYQLFGASALALLVPLLLLPWRLFAKGASHITRPLGSEAADDGWTLPRALRHHAFWALFATFFFTAIGMFSIAPQVVAYLIDAGFLPLQAATAWGFSGVVLLFGMLGVLARRRDRAQAVGSVQLCAVDRGHSDAVGPAVCAEHLAPHWLRDLLRQHDRLARSAAVGDRDEDLSRQVARHDLWNHHDRFEPGRSARLMGRRRHPRPHPQLQSADRAGAGQRHHRHDSISRRPRAA
ncbi:fragment of conserved hypothetical protein (part 1) [Bradyrhizobium sp. STM 3843]|nr:fragment of conserved hypothetical protein (part 1) [Bradyrhizobium sp. STM 3843]